MTKSVIENGTVIAKKLWDEVIKDIRVTGCWRNFQRLRTCNAVVYETENFYVLRSYQTLVAAVDKRNGNAVDVLRLVYGYTATSAQHINKFFKDYDAVRVWQWRQI